jgi:prepilin-type N-terminal cleavage/methylation domain-containing protein
MNICFSTNVINTCRRGFTLLEVMIATMILAIGIGAALDAIFNNNSLRRQLDDIAMADLVLRQMAARLKSTNLTDLGHVYSSASGQAQGWTMHLRATGSTNVAAAISTAPALAQPFSSGNAYSPPYRPLTQQDLIDASILRETVPLDSLSMYIEYYNLSTVTGLQNVAGALVPVEEGLLSRFNDLQDANATANSRQLWYGLVGDPDPSHRSPQAALSPTDSSAVNLIMPASFTLANIDQPGTPEQIRGAFNHGVVIRILISWRPSGIQSSNSNYRTWRETIIVKRD